MFMFILQFDLEVVVVVEIESCGGVEVCGGWVGQVVESRVGGGCGQWWTRLTDYCEGRMNWRGPVIIIIVIIIIIIIIIIFSSYLSTFSSQHFTSFITPSAPSSLLLLLYLFSFSSFSTFFSSICFPRQKSPKGTLAL